MKFYKENKPIGNMVLYNTTSNEWKTIGHGIAGNAIHAIAVKNESVYVCGPGIYSYSNLNTNLRGVATFVTSRCHDPLDAIIRLEYAINWEVNMKASTTYPYATISTSTMTKSLSLTPMQTSSLMFSRFL